MKMYGSNIADTLVGTAEYDTIVARAGNDLIATAGNIDVINAGDGDDLITGFNFNLRNVYLSENRKSIVDGGSGSHDIMLLEMTPARRASEVDLFKDAMTVRGVEEFIYNFTSATAQKQILGSDIAKGLETIVVDSGTANIDLRKGNDFAFTAEGDDLINGGKGSDFIHAGEGHNTVTGGAGTDYFHFHLTDTYQYTEITDFESGVDKLLITIDTEQVNLRRGTSYESPFPVRTYGDRYQGVGDELNAYVSYNNGRAFDADDFTSADPDLAFDDWAYYEQSTGSIFIIHYQEDPADTEIVLVASVTPGTVIDESDFSFRMI